MTATIKFGVEGMIGVDLGDGNPRPVACSMAPLTADLFLLRDCAWAAVNAANDYCDLCQDPYGVDRRFEFLPPGAHVKISLGRGCRGFAVVTVAFAHDGTLALFGGCESRDSFAEPLAMLHG